MWQPPPKHPNFDGLPYPIFVGTPAFLKIKMTAKDVQGQFRLRFYEAEKIGWEW